MRTIFKMGEYLALSLIVSSCVSHLPVRAQESTNAYEFFVSDRYVPDPKSFLVHLVYRNRSNIAQCVASSDTIRGAIDRGVRVFENGVLLNSTDNDFRNSIPVRGDSLTRPVVIIPPSEELQVFLTLDKLYTFTEGNAYSIRYTLPVSKCADLLEKAIPIPSGFDVRYVDRVIPVDSWEKKLVMVGQIYSEWASSGFFAEMQEFTIKF